MLNSKVHKNFINKFVFINHFGSPQIYEHFSQHGNTVSAACCPQLWELFHPSGRCFGLNLPATELFLVASACCFLF